MHQKRPSSAAWEDRDHTTAAATASLQRLSLISDKAANSVNHRDDKYSLLEVPDDILFMVG